MPGWAHQTSSAPTDEERVPVPDRGTLVLSIWLIGEQVGVAQQNQLPEAWGWPRRLASKAGPGSRALETATSSSSALTQPIEVTAACSQALPRLPGCPPHPLHIHSLALPPSRGLVLAPQNTLGTRRSLLC